MADKPSKADITAIFKRLRSIPTNKQCFDCGHSNPTWASVTYGVFLCIDCSAVHRSLGVHVTFIRSTQLDTNWTWLQVRAMQLGGNAAATAFFRQHGCDTTDAQKKYHSRASGLYRERLLSKAQAAMRLHGTKLFLESGHPHDKVHIDIGHPEATSPEAKEVDFFKEHTELDTGDASPVIPALSSESKLFHASEPQPIKNGSLGSTAAPEDPSAGPNVEAALSMSPTQAQAISEPRKTLIGTKKPGAAKKGKGGLGAQRVKTDFKEIENQAVRLDQEREELAKANAIQEAKTKEEQEKQMATMRLAYQDMSLQRQRQEDKLKAADPKKAEQFERLGMGFAGNRGISHSAMSDMQTIQQETPSGDRGDRDRDRFRDRYDRGGRKDFFEDEFEMLGGFSSSKSSSRGYSDSLYGAKKDDFGSKRDDFSSKNDDFGTWGNPNKEGSWDMDRFDSKPSSSFIDSSSSRSGTERPKRDPSGRSRKTETSAEPTSDIAQKRFGNAKSISSEQFFAGTESSFEAQQNLGRLAGRSGFGSDDYFGRGDTRSTRGSSSNTPDLQDIKDGVKQGVTKVAGKLSNLANGVITSLQDRYT